MRYICIVLLFLGVEGACLLSYSQTDSLHFSLDSVSIVSKRVSSNVKGSVGSTLYWNMGMMHDLPKILGNADPLHYTQLLPGVQTCSEYDAGLHIQGCDNAHNFVAIDDVPVYNASHLLGFFSIFNSSHFPLMRFDKTPLYASAPNRLGGALNMMLVQDLQERASGEFTIGPMSSQGTFRTPMGKNGVLNVSLRSAYLNLLYGQWLKFDEEQIAYHFQDYNVTYLHRLGKNDKLWLNFYYGDDNVIFDDNSSQMGTKMKWGNVLSSLRWQHQIKEEQSLSQMVYFTRYWNNLRLNINDTEFLLPSHINSLGYKGKWESRRMRAGVDMMMHYIQPQSPNVSGLIPIKQTALSGERSQEIVCYMDYSQPWGNLTLNAGVKGSLYSKDGMHPFYSVDPTLSLTYNFKQGDMLRLALGSQHQYLIKTGFSNMGLPTEFWFSSGGYSSPQYSQSISTCYETMLFNGDYSLTLEAYYKLLDHQVEYNGTILDFLSNKYELGDMLLVGDGENYGINVMLNKRTGKLTGWLSYALGRAFRRFDNKGYKGRKYPASHERIYEFNAVATYRFSNRWSVGGTFVYASGTPFTAPKHFYLMNGQLVSEFGEHNANRLNPYSRLDLSVNYTLKKHDGYERGLNFSLYNTLFHGNDIFYRLKIRDSKFYYQPVHFILNALPSISYYCKF